MFSDLCSSYQLVNLDTDPTRCFTRKCTYSVTVASEPSPMKWTNKHGKRKDKNINIKGQICLIYFSEIMWCSLVQQQKEHESVYMWNPVLLRLHINNGIVLVLSGDRVNFLHRVSMGLCFGFLLETMLMTQGCFHYC